MNTKIVVDSSASLYTLQGVDFECVPLKIITDDAEYLDNGTMDAVGMAQTLRTYKGKTSTSCPNVSDWLAAYEGADEVYAITITGTLSGSYNAAQLAAEEYQQENPGKRVFVLDSLSTGPEQRLLEQERYRSLYGAMSRLSANQREMIWLVYFEDMSISQAANIIHKTQRQGNSILFRARQSLKAILEKEGFEYENKS